MRSVEVSLMVLIGLVASVALGSYLSRLKPDWRWGEGGEEFLQRLRRAVRGLPIGTRGAKAEAAALGASREPDGDEAAPEAKPTAREPRRPPQPARSEDPLPAEASAVQGSGRLSRSTGRDRIYGEVRMGGLRVVGASVIGSSHEKVGQPREDAFFWRELAGGGLVTAIADGVGSTRHADVAARLAVGCVVEEIVGQVRTSADERDWQSIAERAVHLAADRLQPEMVDDVARRHSSYPVPAEKKGRSPACTLLATMLIPEPTGLSVYWVSVGDNQLLSRDVQRSPAWRIETGSEPADKPRGRYLSNATDSLPRDLGRVTVGHQFYRTGTLVLLATDGFIRTLEIRSDPADPFVSAEQLWSITPDEFLAAVDEPFAQCWDDRTVILIQAPSASDGAGAFHSWWGF